MAKICLTDSFSTLTVGRDAVGKTWSGLTGVCLWPKWSCNWGLCLWPLHMNHSWLKTVFTDPSQPQLSEEIRVWGNDMFPHWYHQDLPKASFTSHLYQCISLLCYLPPPLFTYVYLWRGLYTQADNDSVPLTASPLSWDTPEVQKPSIFWAMLVSGTESVTEGAQTHSQNMVMSFPSKVPLHQLPTSLHHLKCHTDTELASTICQGLIPFSLCGFGAFAWTQCLPRVFQHWNLTSLSWSQPQTAQSLVTPIVFQAV